MSRKRNKKTPQRIPSKRAGFASTQNNDIFCILGGYDENGNTLNDFWIMEKETKVWSDIKYEQKMAHPFPRMEFDACLLNESKRIYLFAGLQNIDGEISILNDLWFYDLSNKTWCLHDSNCPISERSGYILLAINDYTFLIHGF
jgi:N-acetylneuraminic acid mutarotase